MRNHRFSTICALAIISSVNGFYTPLPFGVKSSRWTQGGCLSMSSPAPASVDQKTAVKTKTIEKTKIVTKQATTSGPTTKKASKVKEPPMFKVNLLGDEEYIQEEVVARIVEVMEDVEETQAKSIFEAAQATGKALCGRYPLEHAELYVEQLMRSEPIIYGEVESEKKKKNKGDDDGDLPSGD